MKLTFPNSLRAVAVAAVLTAACVPASASVFDSGDNHPYFGVRVGLDVELPGNWWVGDLGLEMYTPGCGIAVGGIYNLPLVANLYFEPGLTLFYNTAGSDISTIDADMGMVKDIFSKRTLGLRVPLQFGYRFDITERFAVAVFTGPELTVRFDERLHAKTINSTEEYDIDENLDDSLKRFGLGWKVGGSLAVDRWTVSLSGNIGLLNRIRNAVKGVHFRENIFNVSVGYNF